MHEDFTLRNVNFIQAHRIDYEVKASIYFQNSAASVDLIVLLLKFQQLLSLLL